MELSSVEKSRYSRHLTLPQVGEAGQLKLKKAKVLLIGAGGLGSPIALYLAAAGVGRITVVDHDEVCLSNLQRQILFKTHDIGKKKSEKAKAHLNALNPDIQIAAFSLRVDLSNIDELISTSEIVIDGSDNFTTRYVVNDACVRARKPLIFGAIHRFDGQVSVFAHDGNQKQACYRCLYPLPPPLEAVANCAEAGVLGILPGVIGTLMATEAIKLILQIGRPLTGKIMVYDALHMKFDVITTHLRLDCIACGEKPLSLDRLANDANEGIELVDFKNLLANRDCTLIDVRSDEEFAHFHLPEAVSIPLSTLKQQIEKIPLQKPIVFICQSGQRSERALQIFQELVTHKANHLKGGLAAFTASL